MIAAALALMLLPAVALPTDWSQEEVVQRVANGTYHWGQPGESSPNNGWSSYQALVFDPGLKMAGSAVFIELHQRNGEFSVIVREKDSKAVRFRALRIGNAGLFYSPPGSARCQPDAMERLGLYGELALFHLAQGFSKGPGLAESKDAVKVDARPVVLRFMQGVMTLRDGVHSNVSVTRTSPSRMDFAFIDDQGRARATGAWISSEDLNAISDDELLANWTACWHDGRPPQGKESMQTLGDVRARLRAIQ